MNELQIFNSDVIPVYITDKGEKVVIGRELYERLNIDTPYTQWFERMCEYGFSKKSDYFSFSQKSDKPQGGRPSTNHLLTLDMAKHIAMIQRTPDGKAIRQKLIDLEKKVQTKQVSSTEKLQIQDKRVEAMLLNAKTRAYLAIMNSVKDKGLSSVAVEVFGLAAIEGITGKDTGYRPQIEKTYTASELAKELGVSANKIGRIATKNNVKTDNYGVTVMDKSRYSSKEIPNFRYNEAGRKRIAELLSSEGGADHA